MLIKRILSAGAVSAVGMLMQVFLFVKAGAALAVDEFSHFALVMGYSVLVSQLVSLGYAQVSTRLLSVGKQVGGSAYSVSFLLIIISTPVAYHFLNFQGALVLVLFCLKFVNKRVLMSGKYGGGLVFLDELLWIIPPLLFLFLSTDYQVFLDVIACGLLVSVFLQIYFLSLRKMAFPINLFDFLRSNWKSSFFVVVFLAGRLFANRLDIFIVSEQFSELDFSAFSLAHRLSYVANFVPLVLSVVMSSRIAILYSEGDMEGIKKLLLYSCFAAFVSIFLGVLTFVFAGDFLLSEYASGRYYNYFLLFLIMMLSQGVVALSGISQMILIMSGSERYIGTLVFFLCALMYVFLSVSEFGDVIYVAMVYLVFSAALSLCSFLRVWSILRLRN